MRKLLELRRGYSIAEANEVQFGAVTYDRVATEGAIEEWRYTAALASAQIDDKPNVVRTVLPALGIVTLTVLGWHET